METKMASICLDTRLLTASTRLIGEASATILLIKVASGIVALSKQSHIKKGMVSYKSIDHLKQTVPAFKSLYDLHENIPRTHLQAFMKDASTVGKRNGSSEFFYASVEAQLENSERLSRELLANGIKQWRELRPRLF